MEDKIKYTIKKFESRCVCTEEYYCKPCKKVERLKEVLDKYRRNMISEKETYYFLKNINTFK